MAEVGKYYITVMPDMSKFASGVQGGLNSGMSGKVILDWTQK